MENEEVYVEPLITYRPAELKEGKRWRVEYYAWHPFQRKLKRVQIQLMYIKRVKLRRQEARILCEKINAKLRSGWNPFLEQEAPKAFTLITNAASQFLDIYSKNLKEGTARHDTLRSYKSNLSLFLQWLKETGQESTYCIHVNQALLRHYLHYVYIVRDNGARTHNNHRTFLHTFCEWLVEYQYCKVNPVKGIKTKTVQRKKRQVIPVDDVVKMFADKEIPSGYRLLCRMALLCLIRRKELTMLRVGDIKLKDKCIVVPSEVSKNNREQAVAIPEGLFPFLIEHMRLAKNTDWLFCRSSNWKPGKNGVHPTTVSATWARIRKRYQWPDTFHWYSLKDTGITEMLRQNIPTLQVRDQARHSDISITNKYIAQLGQNFGDEIRDFNI